ncbi:MAG: cobalamin-dependent protein [Candidatus Eisenbacteria bacterium]
MRDQGKLPRVLLVRPPIYSKTLDYPAGPRFGLPVGLLYLAAYLQQQGIDVHIYDALVDFRWDELHRNERGHYHIGATWPRMVQRVLEHRPDIIGIANPFSDMTDYTLRTATEIKAARADVLIVVGGPHATACPEHFLSDGGPVDFVVRGEGEKIFHDLILAHATGVSTQSLPGVSYCTGADVRSNPPAPFIADLDNLPLPAYSLVPMSRYFELARVYPSRFTFEYPGSEREVSIITSRGCPFKCVFCGNHLHMGRRWRYHSVAYVLSHMELLVDRYDVRHFHI